MSVKTYRGYRLRRHHNMRDGACGWWGEPVGLEPSGEDEVLYRKRSELESVIDATLDGGEPHVPSMPLVWQRYVERWTVHYDEATLRLCRRIQRMKRSAGRLTRGSAL